MSQKKLSIIFDKNALKLIQTQWFITYVQCISASWKRTSGSWFLSRWWNINFGNIALELFRIFPPNFRKLQTSKEYKNCMIFNFFYFKCKIILSDNYWRICRKMKTCPIHVTFLHNSLYGVAIRGLKSLLLLKNSQITNI